MYNIGKSFIIMKPQLPMEEIIEALRDYLHPALFDLADDSGGSTTTYRIFKKTRFLQDESYSAHPSVRRLSYGLWNMLYIEEADCNRDCLETPVTSLSATVYTPLSTLTFTLTYCDSDQRKKI